MTTNTSTTSQWYSCHRMIVHQSTDITYVWSACSVSIPFNRDSIACRAQLRLRRFLRAKVVWRAQHRRTRLLWAEVSGRTLLRHSARIETWETQGGFLVKSDEWRILDEKPINVNPGFTVYTLWLEFNTFSQTCQSSWPVASKKIRPRNWHRHGSQNQKQCQFMELACGSWQQLTCQLVDFKTHLKKGYRYRHRPAIYTCILSLLKPWSSSAWRDMRAVRRSP